MKGRLLIAWPLHAIMSRPSESKTDWRPQANMHESFYLFLVAGFLAQMVDGMLGMAYGVSCNALLLSLGVGPAAASASVHTAKFFTTSFSGFFHWKLGNVDPAVWKKLCIPGAVGGVMGACLVSRAPVEIIKPAINVYLLVIGISIIARAFNKKTVTSKRKALGPLGLLGGFADAVGGGGWGPIVTSSLVVQGEDPRLTVGSVNLAEFFVTAATSATFFATLGLTRSWNIILGLIIGGLIASPFAAVACKRVNPKPLMAAVGVLIIGLSVFTIAQTINKFGISHVRLAAAPNVQHE